MNHATHKNAAAAGTATALRIHTLSEAQMRDQDSTLPGIANTYPQRLRAIAKAIDGAEHCVLAAELREIARGLSSSTNDLLDQAQSLDGFFQVENSMERASIIGRAIGAIRSSAAKIVGFEVAHQNSKAVA